MALVTVVVPEHAMTEGRTYSLTVYWQNPSEFEKEFYGLTQGKGIGIDLGQTTVKGRWVKVLEWPTSRPAFLLELSETTPDPSGPAGGTTKVVAAMKRTHGFTQGESITFDPAITDTDAWGDQEPKATQPAIVTGAVPGTDQHPAEAALRAFIDHIANKRFESAYALISEEARANGDSTVREAPVTWESFCFELTVRPGDLVALIQFIEAGLKELDKREELPSSAPVLGHSVGRPSMLDSAPLPVELLRILKCNNLTVGEIRILPDGRVQIPVVTRYGGRVVDRDQVVLVEEPDGWKITNPIHFIR